jgi:hypothetical protein
MGFLLDRVCEERAGEAGVCSSMFHHGILLGFLLTLYKKHFILQ